MRFTNPYFPPKSALTCSGSGECVSPLGRLHFHYMEPPKEVHALLQLNSHVGNRKKGALSFVGHASLHRTNRTHGMDKRNNNFKSPVEQVISTGSQSSADDDGQTTSQYSALDAFALTKGICWRSERDDEEKIMPLGSVEKDEEAQEMLDALECIMSRERNQCRTPSSSAWTKVRAEALTQMWLCSVIPSCQAINFAQITNIPNLQSSTYTYSEGVGPYPARDCQQYRRSVSLQKIYQLAASKKDVSLESSRYDMPWHTLADVLSAEYDAGCWCSRELSPYGCYAYHIGDEPHFWCYIDTRSVESCKRQGYNVLSAGARYWTEDVCHWNPKQACACSGWGMPPPFDGNQFQTWKHTAAQELLKDGGGQWRYGSSCDAWDVGKPEWCIVGFDTSCPDRMRVDRKFTFGKKTETFSVDASYMACSQKKLQETMNGVGSRRCSFIIQAAIATLVVFFATGVLMQDVAYEFLNNRCGDRIQDSTQDEQFEVEAESGDEDTWTVKHHENVP